MEKVHYSKVMTDNDILEISRLYVKFENKLITFKQLRLELELIGYEVEKYIYKQAVTFKNSNLFLTDENITSSLIEGLLLTRGNMHHILYKKDYKAICMLAQDGDLQSKKYLEALNESSNIKGKVKTLKK